MFGLSFEQLALLVCVPLASFAVISFIYSFDRHKEDRRNSAMEIAFTMQDYGLVRIPQLFKAYAIGNYSKLLKSFADIVKLFLGDKKQVVAELDGVFERVLEKKSATPEGREAVLASLKKFGFQTAAPVDAQPAA